MPLGRRSEVAEQPLGCLLSGLQQVSIRPFSVTLPIISAKLRAHRTSSTRSR
jgi:hypothetical protein